MPFAKALDGAPVQPENYCTMTKRACGNFFFLATIAFALFTNLALSVGQNRSGRGAQPPGNSSAPKVPETIEYRDVLYRFTFTLPASWKGYTILHEEWKGGNNNGSGDFERGPIITLRHPKWTRDNPRQDIPIMIFTLAQWKAIEAEELFVSAAPIGPGELARNRKYVFALPPRYNFAEVDGIEEVKKIIDSNPLHTF
jgi:hypothetical protein